MGISTSYSKAEIEIKEAKLKQIFASGLHEKPLKIGDPLPTVIGGYVLASVGNYSFGTAPANKWNVGFLSSDGWEIVSIAISINPNGLIQADDLNAVSGDTIYKKLISGKIITNYNTWENGYYFTTGGSSTGNTYSMQRTSKIALKKGEKLKFGVNTFNVSGGTAAILNVYNLDGSFKANILKQNDFLNQFKQYEYTATEDILFSLADFSTATFGQRYIEVESLSQKALEPINNRVEALEKSQDEILNGTSELLPEQVIPVNLSTYYYSHNGAIAPTAYGHKRSDLFLVKKGQTVSYGVNTYTQVSSVAVLNTYNLNKIFKTNIKKLDSTSLGKFITGTYMATDDEYVGISDYSDGAYGVAFVKILESEPYNYNKGISYLLDKDKINDDKFSKLNLSDFETSKIYQRGFAKQNLSTVKEIMIVSGGQSNCEGRNDKVTFPASYLNAQGEVKGVQMWNDQTKMFAPLKFGTGGNTGAGAPNAASELDMYAFDAIAAAMLAENKGRTVYMAKRALGGTAIDVTGSNGGGYWTPYTEDIITGRKLIEEFKTKILNALASNSNLEIKACLWHQGEGDSTVTAKVKYYQNFKNVIAYIRGIVGNPKLPFIFGTIAPVSSQYTQEVNDAFFKVFAEDKFTYLIDMKDATLFDPYHFDPDSTALFGQRVFDVLKNYI